MLPYETNKTIESLLHHWQESRLNKYSEWVERSLQIEVWPLLTRGGPLRSPSLSLFPHPGSQDREERPQLSILSFSSGVPFSAAPGSEPDPSVVLQRRFEWGMGCAVMD